ncbi:hypothetical protein Lal_00000754 [Lupinus albus]|nr:hypothetical protein Lal_00000754 [Lupinus albus]
MAIHLYKTSTPSTRNGAVDSQVKSNPRKNLIYGQHHCVHRGGGHKRLYRKIDFWRNEKDIYGRIVTIEYDLIEMHTFVSYTMGMVRKDIFYTLEGLPLEIPLFLVQKFL